MSAVVNYLQTVRKIFIFIFCRRRITAGCGSGLYAGWSSPEAGQGSEGWQCQNGFLQYDTEAGTACIIHKHRSVICLYVIREFMVHRTSQTKVIKFLHCTISMWLISDFPSKGCHQECSRGTVRQCSRLLPSTFLGSCHCRQSCFLRSELLFLLPSELMRSMLPRLLILHSLFKNLIAGISIKFYTFSGVLVGMDAMTMAKISLELGAGRNKVGDPINYSVGIMLVKVGTVLFSRLLNSSRPTFNAWIHHT